MQRKIISIILLLLGLTAMYFFIGKIKHPVVETSPIASEDQEYSQTLPDDFYAFYNKFHTDSLFQLNHIQFPLKGLVPSQDTSKVFEEIFWYSDTWKLHRPFNDQNGTFERIFINFHGIITEQISANNGLLKLEKRYTKLNDNWHLIYYQALTMF